MLSINAAKETYLKTSYGSQQELNAVLDWADLLLKSNQYDLAFEKYAIALDEKRYKGIYNAERARALTGSALCHENKGEYEKMGNAAHQAYLKAPSGSWREAFALENEGRALKHQKHYMEAIEKYNSALTLGGYSEDDYQTERTRTLTGIQEAAHQAYLEAPNNSYQESFAIENEADAMRRKGQYTQAIEKYNLALTRGGYNNSQYNDEQARVLIGLALCYEQIGNNLKMEEVSHAAYIKALSGSWRESFALENEGDALRHQGKLAQAATKYSDALTNGGYNDAPERKQRVRACLDLCCQHQNPSIARRVAENVAYSAAGKMGFWALKHVVIPAAKIAIPAAKVALISTCTIM